MPNAKQFNMAKSILSTNVPNEQFSSMNGSVNVFAQVFAVGNLLVEENLNFGVGENPGGGIWFELVAKIKISSSFTFEVSSAEHVRVFK